MRDRIDVVLDFISIYVVSGILIVMATFFGIIAFLIATCCLLGI